MKNPYKRKTTEYKLFEWDKKNEEIGKRKLKNSKFFKIIKSFYGIQEKKNESKSKKTIQKNRNKNKKNKCEPDN